MKKSAYISSITVGIMGATALKKHMGYDKNRALVKAHKIQSELRFHADNELKASTSSNSSVKQKNNSFEVLL